MGISALVLGAAVGIGAIGATAISGGFSSKSSTTPKPPALPSAPNPAKSEAAAQMNASKRRAAQTQTVYSSPLGVSNQDQAQIARKTLTGQ